MHAAGILSNPAVQRINDSVIKKLIITNTIPLAEDKKSDKIVVISLAPMLAEFIECIQSHDSVSKLFQKY